MNSQTERACAHKNSNVACDREIESHEVRKATCSCKADFAYVYEVFLSVNFCDTTKQLRLILLLHTLKYRD